MTSSFLILRTRLIGQYALCWYITHTSPVRPILLFSYFEFVTVSLLYIPFHSSSFVSVSHSSDRRLQVSSTILNTQHSTHILRRASSHHSTTHHHHASSHWSAWIFWILLDIESALIYHPYSTFCITACLDQHSTHNQHTLNSINTLPPISLRT